MSGHRFPSFELKCYEILQAEKGAGTVWYSSRSMPFFGTIPVLYAN